MAEERKLRSQLQYGGIERSLQRAWAKGAGLIDEEFARPMIAVVNTYQDFSPENAHLRQVGEAVCAGIRMAGGTPCMFNTFHVTDSETFASVGMRYVLPSRDVVADMIELMVEGHRFDGMVLIGSGDKVVPGMVMAASRLDLPAILIYGGPTPAGVYHGKKVFLETVYDAVGEHIRGQVSRADLKGLEDHHFPFSGACDTATSGNTAGIYTEAIGLALPGSGTMPAGSNYQLRAAKYTGMRILDLVRADVRPSAILTQAAFENAIRVGMAVGGSTNMVLHLIAMAKEAGVDVSFDTFDRFSRSTPTLVKLAPSGPWGVTDLHAAGGVPAVLKALGSRIARDCLTVSGRSVGEIVDAAVIEDARVIRPDSDPVEPEAALFIVKGSLAPAATPPWRYDQATVLRMSGYGDPRRMGFFSNSLIETRHLYMDPETFTPDESVDQLNDRWRRGAVEVGKAAVARAIERAGWRLEDVDFLATTTCTGRVCPSLDAQIINELGLRPTIQRVHVGDTGCASAMVAMQQASNHLRAFPGHRAVIVAVEICSAAYFLDDRLESAVAHAIFADGAGAIALSTEAAGPEIVEHRTIFRSEHLGAMGFEYPGGRPRVILSKDVRRIGAGMMREMADALLASQGLKQEDVAHFVLHSAGRRVIEQVGKLMGLDESRLAHSRRVLQKFGNMSSATVVFVLDELMRADEAGPGDWGLMIALGPGFAAEGALLRW